MKRLALILLAFPFLVQAQSVTGGTGVMVASNVIQGAWGTFPAAPGSPTALSACGSLSASGTYQLTQDLGADKTATCLTGAGNVTVDLNGYDIYGYWNLTSTSGSGIHIYSSAASRAGRKDGGGIFCTFAAATKNGCFELSSTSTTWALPFQMEYIRIDNDADPGADAVRAVHLDTKVTTVTNGEPAHKLNNLTVVIHTAATSVRAVALNVTVSGSVRLNNNDLTCPADAAACNTIQVIDGAGTISGNAYQNVFRLANNTTAGDSARGIALSGNDTGLIAASTFNIYDNDCEVNDNRCWRVRQWKDVNLFRNRVYGAITPVTNGIYHFGDPDGANHAPGLNVRVWDETIRVASGTPVLFYSRDQSGFFVKDSRIVGTAGKVASLATPIAVATVAAVGVPGVSRASNVVTLTTTANYGLAVDDVIEVSGVTDATFNGTFTVTGVLSGTQFTYAQTGADATSGGGTVKQRSVWTFCNILGAASMGTNSDLNATTVANVFPDTIVWTGTGTKTVLGSCPF